MKYLSHNHYAISDALAGRLARENTTSKRLPRHGYCVTVPFLDYGPCTLARTTLRLSDPVKNKRGWVWTLMPETLI